MFNKTTEETLLDLEITSVQNALKILKPVDEKYDTTLTQLERLFALKQLEKPQKISADTKATIAANLAGILTIVAYEHSHVITTKALSFLMHLK
jgi:hypothetical protein